MTSKLNECLAYDCKHNRRDNGTCKLKNNSINDRRECVSYVLDLDYLRKSWWGENARPIGKNNIPKNCWKDGAETDVAPTGA